MTSFFLVKQSTGPTARSLQAGKPSGTREHAAPTFASTNITLPLTSFLAIAQMSSRTVLNAFVQSTSRLSTNVRHLSLKALDRQLHSSCTSSHGISAQFGAVNNLFSDWSQEPQAQSLVPFVVEQTVSYSIHFLLSWISWDH